MWLRSSFRHSCAVKKLIILKNLLATKFKSTIMCIVETNVEKLIFEGRKRN